MTASPPPALSILIVGYNSGDLIEGCIGAIADACRNHEYEVLFIDNGDGSTEARVARVFPGVCIIPSKGNIGFAAANNELARHAKARKLVLVNPDLHLYRGSLDALMAGATGHPDAAAWGGVTLNAAGMPDSGNSIAMPSLVEMASVALGRSIAGSRPVAGLRNDERVPTLSGGYVMFDRSVWDEAGGLDERYFLYCEEIDLFYRLARRGWSFWRISDARAYHAIGHGEGHSAMRKLYSAAGTMEFVRAHWSNSAAAAAFVLTWLAALERFLAGRLLGSLRPRMKDMAEGYRLVALKPHLWRAGYDRKRGLLRKLGSIHE